MSKRELRAMTRKWKKGWRQASVTVEANGPAYSFEPTWFIELRATKEIFPTKTRRNGWGRCKYICGARGRKRAQAKAGVIRQWLNEIQFNGQEKQDAVG